MSRNENKSLQGKFTLLQIYIQKNKLKFKNSW